jgi:adiponectin receptor
MYLCCGFALIVVLMPTKKIGWINSVAWLFAGYSSTPGLVHLAFFANTHMRQDFMFWPWITGGIIYAVGAIFYAIGFPETYFKQTFDIFGQSHSIFHVCILIAAALHVYGSLQCYTGASTFQCPTH